MDEIRFTCDGFVFGAVAVPPFDIRSGQIVSFQVSGCYNSSEELALRRIFCGDTPHRAIHRFASVVSAESAEQAGLLADLFPLSAGQWLTKRGQMSASDAESAIHNGANL